MSTKELNIGDYVRFDYHRVTVPILIGKIVHIEYDKAEKHCFYVTDGGLVIGNENIIKSSPNIIDLIEVGDYVNGMKVFEVIKNPEADNIKEHLIVFINEINNELFEIYGDDIKSIVTKEQFEALEYEVKQ